MAKINQSNFAPALVELSLERGAPMPLNQQLAQALRQHILAGRIKPGARLPASRQLAVELAVSRVTVVTAIDQLIAEGYAEARHGAGVFVSADLPVEALPIASLRDHDGAGLPAPAPIRPFQAAAPDLSLFPFHDWSRLSDRIWRRPPADLIANADPLGWAPLRAAIANHLATWRGILCQPEQVVIVSGAADALNILALGPLATESTVLMEEPGYGLLRRILMANGHRARAVPVDRYGMDIARGRILAPDARAALVTPSRQYPLGIVMPLARRLDLIHWALAQDAIIVEDDYDGEYRYRGQPLPAMMSLEGASDHVVYLGSFSKVLWPSLRLGFMVVPERLLPVIAKTVRRFAFRPSILAQPVLAEFIDRGAFASHLRKTRRLYAKRQAILTTAIEHHLGDVLRLDPADGGMHLVARLKPALAARMDDRAIAARAHAAGVTVTALSDYYVDPAASQNANQGANQGLVLGYAGFDAAAIEAAAATLAEVVDREGGAGVVRDDCERR